MILRNFSWCIIGVLVGGFGFFGTFLYFVEDRWTGPEAEWNFLLATGMCMAIGLVLGVAAVFIHRLRPALIGLAAWTILSLVAHSAVFERLPSLDDRGLSTMNPVVWSTGAVVCVVIAYRRRWGFS